MISLAYALLVHFGLNVIGKLPIDCFFTGKLAENWLGIIKYEPNLALSGIHCILIFQSLSVLFTIGKF